MGPPLRVDKRGKMCYAMKRERRETPDRYELFEGEISLLFEMWRCWRESFPECPIRILRWGRPPGRPWTCGCYED